MKSKVGIIICGYPGVGKSSVAGWHGVIDLESSFFSYRGELPQKVGYWVPQYCRLAIDLALQGYTVLTSTHEAVIEYFKNQVRNPLVKEHVVIFCPNQKLKDEWIERLRRRLNRNDPFYYKNEGALNRAKEYFDLDIEYLNNCGLPVYHPGSINYDFRDYICYIRRRCRWLDIHKTDSQMETLEGMEKAEQLQQARSDSDISENQEERLVRELCGLEVREQKMREELSTEWKDLRQRLGNLICRIDGQIASLSAEEKRMEERRDESYFNGVQDLDEAVKAVALSIENGGMTSPDILEYFGTSLALNAISKTDPKTIIEKVNEWKTDKKQVQKADKKQVQKEEKEFNIWEEFRVGDEVELEPGCVGAPRKGIISGIIDANLLNLVYSIDDGGELRSYRVVGKRYKKTGRHFDSIPFMYGY